MTSNNFSGDDHSRGDNGLAVHVDEDVDRSELAARIERLTEENRTLREKNERLRRDSARTRRPGYRRLGLGLALLGTLSGLSVFVFPDAQNVLFAIAATGLFGGVLAYYLSDGPFLDATVCDRIYAAAAANGRALTEERDLREDRVYVPDGDGGARLFVPKEPDFEIPGPDERVRSLASDGRDQGVVLESTGAGLFREFERTVAGELPDSPSDLSTLLADALVEQFELARTVEPSVDHENDRVVVTVSDSRLGDVERFDHPIVSFFAVGLAVGLERPISLDVSPRPDRSTWLATYRWHAADDP